MFQGQLVADLTSARTESALRATLDQLLKQLPIQSEAAAAAAELEPLIAMGEEVLDAGDAERAVSIFEQLLEMAPDHPAVLSGHIRALLGAGRIEDAEAATAALPEALANDPAIHRAIATVSLARSAPPAADYAGLAAEVAASPDDHEKRFALANAQMAAGNRDGAADNLLHIVAADRAWNEDAARQQLLKLFEVVGMTDPWVSQQRRRLSAILFG
jgi:putative thioredoxin